MDHRHIGIKNIIGESDEKQSVIESPSSVQITDDGEYLNIRFKKDFLLSTSNYDIYKLILASVSSLFLNENKKQTVTISSAEKRSFPHIAFFIEFFPHYTGGRYSLYHQALLLSQYTRVTVVTDRKPTFYNDFQDYYNDNFNLVIANDYLINSDSSDFDIAVGVPQMSGQFAHTYAKKWNITLYMMIFESPNYVSQYRDGADGTEEYWSNYKKCMKDADAIITPSCESAKWVADWDPKFKDIPIHVIYPCMNEVVAEKVKNTPRLNNNRKSIVYVSRMTDFKNPTTLFKKLPSDIDIHIIGKIWAEKFPALKKMDNVFLHGSISDKEKFQIIYNCDVMVFPTKFEGFGMPPMEALYFNIPVVTYDIPVLREVYGDSLFYTPVGDEHRFVQVVLELLSEGVENCGKPKNIQTPKFADIKSCANNLIEVFNVPKVTAGVMVYNGADYLEYAVKSLYPYLYQIIIVDGAVEGYSKNANSTDGTLNIIEKLKQNDIMNKIEVVKPKGIWKDKIQKQNEIAKRVNGKYYVKLDADEIWSERSFLDVIDILEEKSDVTIVRMPFYHFWLNFKMIAKDAGGKWSTRHPRIWKWKKEFRHNSSFNFFQDKDKKKVGEPNYMEYTYQGTGIFHFGWARDLKTMINKIKYYKNRGIEKFVRDTVTNWDLTKNSDTQPTQHVRSWAEEFKGDLPEILYNHPYKDLDDSRNLNKEK